MAYRLDYTPLFRTEFSNVLLYIGEELQNPIAAGDLLRAFSEAEQSITTFPKATKPHIVGPAREPYYHIRVKNYLAFYVVLEDTVEFRRFLYARSAVFGKLSERK